VKVLLHNSRKWGGEEGKKKLERVLCQNLLRAFNKLNDFEKRGGQGEGGGEVCSMRRSREFKIRRESYEGASKPPPVLQLSPFCRGQV